MSNEKVSNTDALGNGTRGEILDLMQERRDELAKHELNFLDDLESTIFWVYMVFEDYKKHGPRSLDPLQRIDQLDHAGSLYKKVNRIWSYVVGADD